MKPALYSEKLTENKVQCKLCPLNCKINDGKTGICLVRKNINGELFSENYGKVCSIAFDPIEKKPLYHFYPGSIILSIGSVGCNLKCKFCQNWEISQTSVKNYPYLKDYSLTEILNIALENKQNTGIAYTYNEPTVWYEFMLDIAKQAKKNKLKNVIVTNGFINKEPLKEIINYMDAFSVDLKAFTEEFYQKYTSSKLEPVKETIKFIKGSGKHLELTNLVITDLNDNEQTFSKMIDWIAGEIGKNTVFHISRYYPTYKMNNPATSKSTLLKLYEIAKKKLNYVYLGNIRTGEGQNTFCENCRNLVVTREGYFTDSKGLDDEGCCVYCKQKIM